jgi:hypothetical protein
MKLKEVGARMGVTKERIRQIEIRSLSKLREAVQEEKIERLTWTSIARPTGFRARPVEMGRFDGEQSPLILLPFPTLPRL